MIVQRWHNWLMQPKKTREWHEADIADEYAELLEAETILYKWSELSDVVYTVTRARWSGHRLDYPITRPQVIIGYVYMYPKYTLRTLFFRSAGRKAGAPHIVQCVRNPRKVHKLQAVAEKNQLDPVVFVDVCTKQLKYWPLLP